MTRPDRFHELRAGLGEEIEEHEFTLPPLGESWDSLRTWMRSMREKARNATPR